MAITKKPKNVNEYAYAAKLYYDDIVEIISILKELSPSKIEISSNNFVFDNVEDLLDFDKKHISTLEITSRDPYVNIEFKPDSISLFSTEDKHEVVGAIHKIKLFLKTKRPFFAFHIHSAVIGPLYILIYGILSVSIAFPLSFFYLKLSPSYSTLFGLGVYALAIMFYYFMYHQNYSSIILLRESEQNSFLSRKKDDIFVGIIVGGILAILAYIFSLLGK